MGLRFVRINPSLCGIGGESRIFLGRWSETSKAPPIPAGPLMSSLCRISAKSLDLHVKVKVLGDSENVLVAPPAHIHHDDMVCRQGRRDLHHMRQSV